MITIDVSSIKELSTLIRIVLAVFNDQVKVEKGFSKNTAMTVTNLSGLSTASKMQDVDNNFKLIKKEFV